MVDDVTSAGAILLEGPLFYLEPLALRLGGTVRSAPPIRAPEKEADQESEEEPPPPYYTLEVADTRVLFGPGNQLLTIGSRIIRLSQPVILGERGLMAPLDFFEQTFGDLLGYRFSWDEESRRLEVLRAESRLLPVSVDIVHLQGVSTVVLEFPEQPRYRVEEEPGRIRVLLQGDRLSSDGQTQTGRDPLVRRVSQTSEAVVLDLVPGTAAESYTLRNPFRLVFDVYRSGAPARASNEELVGQRQEGIRIIVLDPGHGGSETGAVGPGGAVEKDVTLVIAQLLKARLERRFPVRVVLTRGDDTNLALDTRAAIANQNKADLFISLHLNSVAGGGGEGAETYFLSLQASDEKAAELAALENLDGDGQREGAGEEEVALADLQLILWDLAQSHHLAQSQSVARLIQEELNGALGLRDRGVKQAPFRVLMGAAMPAVLVELGFLSNPREEGRLQDPGYRAELVEALVRAVARYRVQVEQHQEAREEITERTLPHGKAFP